MLLGLSEVALLIMERLVNRGLLGFIELALRLVHLLFHRLFQSLLLLFMKMSLIAHCFLEPIEGGRKVRVLLGKMLDGIGSIRDHHTLAAELALLR